MSDRLNGIFRSISHGCGPDGLLGVSYTSETGQWSFELPHLTLLLHCANNQLKSELSAKDDRIHRKVLDPLRQEVRRLFTSTNAGYLPKNDAALVIVLFEALEFLLRFEVDEAQAATADKWRVDETFNHAFLTEAPGGLDVSSVADSAFHILGKSPEQFCAEIPEEFRIVHVETILRHDLRNRFQTHRSKLESKLRQVPVETLRRRMAPHSELKSVVLSTLSKEQVINDMLKPRVTFHGTPLRNVGSIVRHGFKLPGTRIQDEVVASPRSGIAFQDRGIYSSQAPFYALSYAQFGRRTTPMGDFPTMRLFVCATVMGRTLSPSKDRARTSIHGPLVDGYDAHFDGAYEYIVHNPAAILPCYVIHLDLGSSEAKRALREAQEDPFSFDESHCAKPSVHPRLLKPVSDPGEKERIAAAKKAAAMKWFPNGYGPAKGTSFVIEEIADVDDDEEEYGEWQADRRGFYNEGTHVLDQYQGMRTAK